MEIKSLTKKEKQLIAEFRLCSESDKRMIMQIASEHRKSEDIKSDNNTEHRY